MAKIKTAETITTHDTRGQAATDRYQSLDRDNYLETLYRALNILLKEAQLNRYKNLPPIRNDGTEFTVNPRHWPGILPMKALSKKRKDAVAATESEETTISFSVKNQEWRNARHFRDSFGLSEIFLRVRFSGDSGVHSFYTNREEMIYAQLVIGKSNDTDAPFRAFLMTSDYEIVKFWELEEFAMVAVTDGHIYNPAMLPREMKNGRGVFTCFNRERNLLYTGTPNLNFGLFNDEMEMLCSIKAEEMLPPRYRDDEPELINSEIAAAAPAITIDAIADTADGIE
jgi:hypothetical protein